MKQKIIVLFSILLFLGAIAFMAWDFYFRKESDQKNPYVYDISNFRKTDSASLCYHETVQIKPDATELKGIATGSDDQIFITGDDKVFCFDKDGKLVFDFQTENPAQCIATSPSGEIFLGIENHIEIWNESGKLIKKWEAFNVSSFIASIAITEKYVYVADAGNKKVFRYDHDGNLSLTIGEKNPEKGIPGFIIPSPYFDLLLGRDGELWVVNPGRHAFEAYNENGDLISTWNKTSMQTDGFSGCCNPSHIAILSDGSFVTSEKGIERVKIHLPSGEFKCVVAGPEQFIEGTTGLDLATDSNDRILVLDPGKGIVRIFEK
jgi:DNA-binding beta-propeller fold protein YncE